MPIMRFILTVQQSLLDLRSNLTAISSTASKGQDDLKTLVQETLITILQSENDFVNSAMEVRLPCNLFENFRRVSKEVFPQYSNFLAGTLPLKKAK